MQRVVVGGGVVHCAVRPIVAAIKATTAFILVSFIARSLLDF